jgi:hypothetical protein
MLALLRSRGIMTMTPVASAPDVPALVPLIAGGPVKGSWWGHPRGKAIFAAATEVDEHPDALAVKLLAGKVTFVHRALFAPLLRCVTDARWRRRVREALSAAARALDDEITAAGSIAFPANPPKALAELESRLLCLVGSVHTDQGRHATVAEAWRHWARARAVAIPRGSRAAALAALEGVAGVDLLALRDEE